MSETSPGEVTQLLKKWSSGDRECLDKLVPLVVWKRVREVFEAALERPRGERADFLDRNCGSDLELGKEVDCLIAHQAEAEEFLQGPPVRGLEMPKKFSRGART